MAIIKASAKNSAGGSSSFYPYEIGQSVRFNDNDSPRFNRTFAAGNRQTWTFRTILKRGNLGTAQALLVSNGTGGFGVEANVYLDTSDGIDFIFDYNAGSRHRLITTQKFRDVGAFYDFVVVADTTNATSTDRLRMYVNGVRITEFTTENYPSLNYNGTMNQAYSHGLGAAVAGGNPFDGYLAETIFVDGSALTPTDFGEFKNEVWIPKAYEGSYGTTGFKLDYSDSAALGDDTSGNANDWTPTNLAATDQMLDSPTNNRVTFSPVMKSDASAWSDGNLTVATTTPNDDVCPFTFAIPSTGKWCSGRITLDSSGGTNNDVVGIIDSVSNWQGGAGIVSAVHNQWIYDSGGRTYQNSTSTTASGYSTFTTGDYIEVFFDADTNSIDWAKNGGAKEGAVSVTAGKDYVFCVGSASGSASSTWTLDNESEPSDTDYLLLTSANLPESVFSPHTGELLPSDNFNAVAYSGNGTVNAIDTGINNTDGGLAWFKSRVNAYSHSLRDTIRGINQRLVSDSTAAESTLTTGTSFDSTGVTINGDTAGDAINETGKSHVLWNWKAGGAAAGVSNTDGSITSMVSANVDAGFSIVGYGGTNGATDTVGHGLLKALDMVVIKDLDTSVFWAVYHIGSGNTKLMRLNTTDAGLASSAYWNNTDPTDSVFTLGTSSAVNAANDYIAYCFHEVEGYSKFGSYTGNASTDGPFIYCGFRPRYIMAKRSDSTGAWLIIDTARDTDNAANLELYPNTTGAETSALDDFDLLSNGFKVRRSAAFINASGGTILFAAFAEMPFKYANAR